MSQPPAPYNQTPSEQTDFFSAVQQSDNPRADYAELCNALYEREVIWLAQNGPAQLSLMKRRLSGLPHHVQRVAHFLSNHSTPLEVDSHNASWQSKQAGKCPGKVVDEDKTEQWYQRYAQHGLVVAIRIQQLDNEHIELDSIDRVQRENQTLHVNKHGWFSFAGEALDPPRQANTTKQMLKPSRSLMTAACCGHSWNHKGKITPRALTLRELLLSATIDWKSFNKTVSPASR